MSVLTTTLLAVAAMIGVALTTAPLLFALAGWQAWQAMPKEVYAPVQPRFLRLRPLHLWIAFACVRLAGNVAKWMGWRAVPPVIDLLSLLIVLLLLLGHLVWATGILRRGEAPDHRLRQFARFAFWGSLGGIVLLLLSAVMNYVAP